MTVLEISEHWPEAEAALAAEGEIVLTRDGKPVAKLMPADEERIVSYPVNKPFSPEVHRKWQEEVFGKGVVTNFVEDFIENGREERF